MNAVIERFGYTPMGTFGRLVVPAKGFRCYTVERPWEDNEPYVSCIPEGRYALKPRQYHRGGYPAYEIVGVPGRADIIIHIGNTMDDLLGCVAPGNGLGFIKGKWAVTASTVTHKAFMEAMDGRTWSIEIKQFRP